MADLATTASVAPPRGGRVAAVAGHAAVWLVTITLVAASLDAGLRLRRWVWDLSEPIHFRSDINRGYGWGYVASGEQGYLNVYEKMARQTNYWPLWIDYAPLRLATMTAWARHNRDAFADPNAWQSDYAFNWPVLWFNAAMELVGVAAAFGVVRKVVRDAARAAPARAWPGEWWRRLRGRPADAAAPMAVGPYRGWAHGLAAAGLLWFNPAMILNAHAWPTWDIWIVPMFLLGLLAAVYGRWFWAGAAMGVGVMFKGQQLVGVPVFVAWTILNGDWRGLLRFACGFGVAMAAVALPWLVTLLPADTLAEWYATQPTPRTKLPQLYAPLVAARVWNWPAIGWTTGVTVAAGALPPAMRLYSRRSQWIALATAAVLVLWPLAVRFDRRAAEWLVPACGTVLLAGVFVRRWQDRLTLVATAAAAALLLGMPIFGAPSAWWDGGVAFGTDHYRVMVAGFTDNLPGLLSERYGWRSIDAVVFTWQWPMTLGLTAAPLDVSMRVLMRSLFVSAVAASVWGVARHARCGDRRLLIAATAPWLAFFCFPTQIHERYLLYAAAIASVWIGHSVGMAMLGLLLTAAAWVQAMHVMLVAAADRGLLEDFGRNLHAWRPEWFDATASDTLLQGLAATHPDLAWGILLAMAVVLYFAVTKAKATS